MEKFPFTYLRGGTSRAVFFHKKHLPADPSHWNAVFLEALGLPSRPGHTATTMGSGLSTRKLAVIAPSAREEADVDYHFFQMNDKTYIADDRGTCGNMASAVGPFAVDEGMVPPTDGDVTVRIFNVNTGRIIRSTFPVKNGRAIVHGDTVIPGVPGSGAMVRLDFIAPGGGFSGKLFPTGNRTDRLELPGLSPTAATIIDCANPVVIVRASDVGLRGDETRESEIPQAAHERLQLIRSAAAQQLGLVTDWQDAAITSTYIPHVVVVSPSQSYQSPEGSPVRQGDMDLCCRAVFLRLHPAYPVAAAVATAAARIPGTVAWTAGGDAGRVVIGHPSGVFPVALDISGDEVLRGTILRTARRLFDSVLYHYAAHE